MCVYHRLKRHPTFISTLNSELARIVFLSATTATSVLPTIPANHRRLFHVTERFRRLYSRNEHP